MGKVSLRFDLKERQNLFTTKVTKWHEGRALRFSYNQNGSEKSFSHYTIKISPRRALVEQLSRMLLRG
jgi:hypothetical protein